PNAPPSSFAMATTSPTRTSQSRLDRPRRLRARRPRPAFAACAERGSPMTFTTVSTDLDRRFREAASAEGLLDVAYDILDTPIGPLLVAVTDRGLCRVSFDPEPEREAESLARSYGLRVLRASRPVDTARRELDEYFAGRRHSFELTTDLRIEAPFRSAVL